MPSARAVEFRGDVSGEWSAALNPVVLSADCRVPAGTMLQVGPGTRVLLAPGASLVVEGTLTATGSESQPVSFLAAAPLTGPWRCIEVTPTGSASLTHCDVRGGGAALATELSGALCVRGGRLTLIDSSLSGSQSNGIYAASGAVRIAGCRFLNNGGERPTDAALHIVSSQVLLGASSAATSVEGSPFGIYNENLAPVDAAGLWWGSATGPQHASNLAGQGVSVSDDVLYSDFQNHSPVLVLGDVDADGLRDMRDVAALTRLAAGMTAASPEQIFTGDLVTDGALDLRDAVALARIVLAPGP